MPNRCFRSPKGRSGKSTKRERPKEERRAHSYKASSLLGKKKKKNHAEPERQRADSVCVCGGGGDSISDRGQRQPDIGRLCICWWEIEKKKDYGVKDETKSMGIGACILWERKSAPSKTLEAEI